MKDPESPEYLGKAAVPGVGKQRSQDRTRTLTHQAQIVHEADRGELFALFDGMGSKGQGGSDAAEVMCDMVNDFFRKASKIHATCEGLQNLLLQGNQIINAWVTDHQTGRSIGGCVGSVVWVAYDNAYILHAGDTAVYCIAESKAHCLTSQHRDQKGLITSFFGIGQDLELEVREIPLVQCEFIVLMSDGIDDRCQPEDIAKIVSGQEPYEAAIKLVQLAKARNAIDDLTAIVLDAGDMLFCE